MKPSQFLETSEDEIIEYLGVPFVVQEEQGGFVAYVLLSEEAAYSDNRVHRTRLEAVEFIKALIECDQTNLFH
jgi:hypothetical protein